MGAETFTSKGQRGFKRILCLIIIAYQRVISPAMAPRCRYLPTCSAYAIEAIEKRGILTGLVLSARRLLKCHPWGGSGYDPVPFLDESHK